MTIDIFDGYWDENEYTKIVLENKKNIYEKLKKSIGDNKVVITFIILYYILNDRKEKISEYSNIINKAKTFLVNNNCPYELILSNIQN